jgi:hypothetical protein
MNMNLELLELESQDRTRKAIGEQEPRCYVELTRDPAKVISIADSFGKSGTPSEAAALGEVIILVANRISLALSWHAFTEFMS